MRIPKVVNILGHDYKVIWVDPSKLLAGRIAECEFPTRVIRMSLEIKSSKYMAWICFLHETKHAQQYESGLSQILDSQAMELDAESFVSFITSLKKQRVI